MQKYDLVLDKYWAPQSDDFRLGNTVSLGKGITYS